MASNIRITFLVLIMTFVWSVSGYTWSWNNPDVRRNWFQFRCTGGKIQFDSGSVICDGQRNNILDWLDRQCRGKQYCSFKPDYRTFGVWPCTQDQSTTISVRCIGGTAKEAHRQAEVVREDGSLEYNGLVYTCRNYATSWWRAELDCRRQAGWRLALPKDMYTIRRLSQLCNLPIRDQVEDELEQAYWIGAERKFNNFQLTGQFYYLDGSAVPSYFFYTGEPDNRYQNCVQANQRLSNEYCYENRKFVCQMGD